MRLGDVRSIIDLLPDRILLVSGGEHVVIAANAAAARLLGRAPDSIVGRPLRAILDENDETAGYLRRCAGSLAPVAGTLSFVGEDGERVECRCNGVRFGAVDRKGKLVPGYATAEGDEILLLHCRPKLSADLPFTPIDEKVEELIRENLRRRDAEEALVRLNETLEQKVAERTRALVEANKRLSAEILERRNAEDALRHAQKMEAVGQLTGGVAHDFNNLLTIITGNLELIEDRFEDPRLLRNVHAARRAVARGERLTQQLLAFSRKQLLRPRVTDINGVVGDIEELLRSSLGSANELVTVLAADLWPCSTDPSQLEIVLLNLVINARDALPGRGCVTIETSNAMLSQGMEAADENLLEGDYVRVAVTDNGTGIAPDILHRVFEPFFTTKETGKGSGLGLSQAYGFVKQSGGHLKLHSELGIGTTVELYFPRAAAMAGQVSDGGPAMAQRCAPEARSDD